MDWQAHISDLIAAGGTPREIAEHIGVTTGAVREIIKGRTKQPRGTAACKLEKLTPATFRKQTPIAGSTATVPVSEGTESCTRREPAVNRPNSAKRPTRGTERLRQLLAAQNVPAPALAAPAAEVDPDEGRIVAVETA